MAVDRSSYLADARRGTTPLHIWKDNVLRLAKVSGDAARAHNDMMVRWYNAGEPAWMAAEGLQLLAKPAPRLARPSRPLVGLGVEQVPAPARPTPAERRAALERSRFAVAEAVAKSRARRRPR